ncbi:hypothetical protein CLAFUW4_14457 [Fulvia fulva]|uniref:Uncharacterized protein n=1 Tax=Passalora fulva TaxID=5499 RepID=A0A9Q8PM09_PASFU|nr:uncharacterized protein CLAFUR5_14289 [Fulvia fulva]KAK4608980.1 hypothetical protein CLAFUR4_14452 [Fulvia fulva]KAK4609872.1 hypothetical protein CLAFUR0_14454 [Fulvia fulva]UJO24844.1 hypothetical protein CLAFUR5_14289 [Fulvia fulva]WPV22596.1 hypothetical protein CLAFUW4_14457 [Fulvia fulva]WPV37721.1 hypothetical protein CLAFUW7_14461 [Fulvia fulva]
MSNASNKPQPPEKRGTCYRWAKEKCKHQHAPSLCKDAHHLFPVISERVSPIVDKLMMIQECPSVKDQDINCQWASDTCCWSHVAITKEEDQKQRKMLELVKKRPWEAVLRYKCTVDGCKEQDQEYASIEDVLQHTRVKHGQPLDDSGSWKNERQPIQEEED